MVFLNILFFAIPESEYNYIHYRNQMENTAFSVLSEKKGWRVKFLKLKEPGYQPEKVNKAEYFFGGKNGFFHLPWSMYLFVKRQKPDVLFVHSFIFPFQLLFLRWFVGPGTRIIIQHHAEKPFTNSIKRGLQKLAYSKADAYLFASADLAGAFLDAGIIKEKTKVYEVMEGSTVFQPKDKTSTRLKLGIESQTVFLWVGRLNENKDPLTVLKAFRDYIGTHQNFSLYLIYGSSEMEQQVKDFISANNLEKFVILVGKVPHQDLEEWFNAADYFVAASLYEGSGIALCEAMACGCVPLVTDIPSFRTMTNNGKLGYLFEAGSDQQLLEILRNLDAVEINSLREKIIEKFEHDLSFKAIGTRIEGIVRSL